MEKSATIDEYITSFPKEVQVLLEQMRATIKVAVPEVEEKISYGIPAFQLNKEAVFFAAYKKHIGMYPMYGMEKFKDEMAPYRGKGTKHSLHFSYNKPLPLELITKITQYKLYKKA